MKKKVLILANNSEGLFLFRGELLIALCKTYEVYVSTPFDERIDDLKAIGCHLIQTDFNRRGMNPVKDFTLARKYYSLVKRINPSIVLTYTIKPNIYGGAVCTRLKVPYITNITGLGTAIENESILRPLAIRLYRYGLRGAQKVFLQNRENLDFMLKNHMLSGAYEVIPGSGVNLDIFSLKPYPQDETIRFVFISRIMREKGIDLFIEAAKHITRKYPNTEFHIYGECEQDYQNQLNSLHSSGIINYHGSVRDIPGVHSFSSCTVHPTYYPEGMSNVLLESCACGRPIITTDRPGCREIVEDGVNGFIVKQKDAKDLIAKIEMFLRMPWEERRNMGLMGRAKVEKEFDRNLVINRYLGEIRGLN